MKKHLQVACAIIENNNLVLAAQRSRHMPLPLKWEFPGGKIEAGETPDTCLLRELREELAVEIDIRHQLPTRTHSYPDFTVTLHPFVCLLHSGEITLLEHQAIAWTAPEQLHQLDWAEADLPIISDYLRFCDNLKTGCISE